MILSYNWLRELTGSGLSPKELADTLTRVGLNIEDVAPTGDGDHALNAEITTNRPDWLCHLGVAHEIAAIQSLSVRTPETTLRESGPAVAGLSSLTVMPGAEAHCPRYTLRVLRGVKVGPSPEWLRQRLHAIGQRSINNIVDITNLVCFEMNQPLHAFDMDKLAEGRIVLRLARAGEEFAAITGEKARLEPDMLVIADAEKAVALAGVKGGANTEVDADTVNVLLESAWFQPRSVRRTARRTRMASESSYRYERGIDPGMTARASARAISLMQELAGGELATGIIDSRPEFGQTWETTMRFSRCRKLLGLEVPREEIRAVFKGLGLVETAADADSVTVRVPSFRQDLKREVDLIEEVIRLVGYDRIPVHIGMPLALAHETAETMADRVVRRTLAGLGYHECVTDSFVPVEWGRAFAPASEPYAIRNPINAERPVLRAALAPSLLEVRRTNRLVQDVRLFELGRVYHKTSSGPVEKARLAILDDRGTQYVRGALEAVAEALSLTGAIEVVAAPDAAGMTPASGGAMRLDGETFAFFGETGEAATTAFDLPLRPALAEAEMAVLAAAPRNVRRYRPLPRFPGVRRDLSLSLPEATHWSEVAAVVRRSAAMLDSLSFESVYRGAGLKPGMKALAFSMLFRAADRSLTDAEVNALRDGVLQALLAAFPGAEQR